MIRITKNNIPDICYLIIIYIYRVSYSFIDCYSYSKTDKPNKLKLT